MSQDVIEFFAPGIPKTAGSKRVFMTRGKNPRPIITDDCKTGKDWRASVQFAAHEVMAGKPLITGPIDAVYAFYFPRPKAHFGTGKNANKLKASAPRYHTKKPDLGKLVRAVEDALTGVVWKDDAQVFAAEPSKWYVWPTGSRVAPGVFVRLEIEDERGIAGT